MWGCLGSVCHPVYSGFKPSLRRPTFLQRIIMNYKDYIVFDFETTSKYPDTTQPVQIAAVAIHGRKLEVIPNSEFQSLIQPIFDEKECAKAGVDPLEDGAVAVHGKTEAMLKKAPSLKSVWANFTDYVNEYNFKKTAWYAPVPVGHNIRGFDLPIVHRICCQEPWGYGPKDKEGRRQSLFNPINEVNSLSNDNLVRGYMGYSKGEAHDALSDVLMTAELFCRTQKMFRRFVHNKQFKGAFA